MDTTRPSGTLTRPEDGPATAISHRFVLDYAPSTPSASAISAPERTITVNRNAKGADSLEQTIRTEAREDSLPVVTLANALRILQDKSYAERAAIKLLDFLLDADRCCGAGRLYIP